MSIAFSLRAEVVDYDDDDDDVLTVYLCGVCVTLKRRQPYPSFLILSPHPLILTLSLPFSPQSSSLLLPLVPLPFPSLKSILRLVLHIHVPTFRFHTFISSHLTLHPVILRLVFLPIRFSCTIYLHSSLRFPPLSTSLLQLVSFVFLFFLYFSFSLSSSSPTCLLCGIPIPSASFSHFFFYFFLL